MRHNKRSNVYLHCCSIIGNPALTLTHDLVELNYRTIPKSDARLLAVGDQRVVDHLVVGGERLRVQCGSVAWRVPSPVVVGKQVVLNEASVAGHLESGVNTDISKSKQLLGENFSFMRKERRITCRAKPSPPMNVQLTTFSSFFSYHFSVFR